MDEDRFLSLFFGIKHPGPSTSSLDPVLNSLDLPALSSKSSFRHEVDALNAFDYSVKIAGSRGDLEFGALTVNPAHGFSRDSIHDLSRDDFQTDFGVIKKDWEIKRFIFGGSFNALEAEIAVRFGLGTKDSNGYIELNVNLFAGFDSILNLLASDRFENEFLPGVKQSAPISIEIDTSGNRLATYTDNETGLRVKAPIIIESDGRSQAGPHVTVLASNGATGTSKDLLKGNIYSANNIGIGQELNGLDQLADALTVPGLQLRVPGIPIVPFGDGDPANDNDWRLSQDDWRHSSQTGQGHDVFIRNDDDEDDNETNLERIKREAKERQEASNGQSGGVNDNKVKVPSGNPGGNIAPAPTPDREDDFGRKGDDPKFVGAQPILFDLTGNGIKITELSNSAIYMDATGDGLQNRTAWADVGNAVLFFDPDDTGKITEARQYVFTEWDPTAKSDMEALASVFDTDGDGVLSGAELADFKVMVTLADGSTVAVALDQLASLQGYNFKNITSIDLTADATNIELPDGSVITGQTTFTYADGTTGTVADVTLTAEGISYRLEQVESFDGSGTRTEVTTAYNADGSIAFVNTTMVSADGSQTTNTYDDNGDGVVDRLPDDFLRHTSRRRIAENCHQQHGV
ncbi:hypothetical protein QTO30_01400 [Yoonia sp. GPGPB17]|uniref:hypothetical protein n=1 Tax=Yoonia sp. GPGPB17 TaxID=3026147 RepID=UPI0030C2F1FA